MVMIYGGCYQLDEIWKDIRGYEGIFQVSNTGKVKSLERIDRLGRKIQEKILTTKVNKNGYVIVHLKHNGRKRTYFVHRLVAIAFLGYEENMDVNHIDGNKENNCLDNLEWVTRKENMDHAWKNGLNKRRKPKKVAQYKNDKLIAVFDSAYDAERKTQIYASHICSCCHGRRKSAGGFNWKYV